MYDNNAILQDFFNKKKFAILTEKDYLVDFQFFLEFTNNKPLPEITHKDIISYLNYLENSRHLKHNTIYKKLSKLRVLFCFLEKKYDGFINPTTYINYEHKSKVEYIKEDILSLDELERFLEVIKTIDIQQRIFFSLIISCALSVAEIMDLTWNDFIEDGEGNIYIHFPSSKRVEDRFVQLSNNLWHLVQQYKNFYKLPADDKNLVFASKYKSCESLSRTCMSKWLYACLKEANISKKVTFSTLLRTSIAYSLAIKLDVNDIKLQLGYVDDRPVRKYDNIVRKLRKSTSSVFNI